MVVLGYIINHLYYYYYKIMNSNRGRGRAPGVRRQRSQSRQGRQNRSNSRGRSNSRNRSSSRGRNQPTVLWSHRYNNSTIQLSFTFSQIIALLSMYINTYLKMMTVQMWGDLMAVIPSQCRLFESFSFPQFLIRCAVDVAGEKPLRITYAVAHSGASVTSAALKAAFNYFSTGIDSLDFSNNDVLIPASPDTYALSRTKVSGIDAKSAKVVHKFNATAKMLFKEPDSESTPAKTT